MNKETKSQTAQFIEQQIRLEKFEKGAVSSLLKYYDNARKSTQRDIQTAIRKGLNHPSRIRLQKLLKEIDGKIKDLTEAMAPPTAKVIGEAGAFSYTDTNRIVSWENRVKGYDNVSLSKSQIAALVTEETLNGHTLNYWMWDALNTENKALKADISAAKIRGVGYKKIMQEMGDDYSRLLTARGNKQNIETVVKSYIQSMNSKAHKDIYEANRDVVKEVEWSAVMEGGNVSTGRGTCPRCAALDGQTFPSVSQAPPCPLHPRCRCMYLPVTKTWKELGFDVEELEPVYDKWYIRSPARKIMQRGNIGGEYVDWWKTRSVMFQNNSIGPVRANLVRGGVIEFQDIIYKNGNLIPLKRLVGEDALKKARKTQENTG